MADRKVKGTILADLVRMIRGNKDRDFSKYLRPEDWEIINKRILPSGWYPFELYQRCGYATFQVLAQGNLDLVRLRGRLRGKELFENVYKSIIVSNDPMTSLSRFVIVYGQFFNFSTVRFDSAGKDHAKIYLDYERNDPGTLPYCHQIMGQLEILIEMAGGKNVKIGLSAKEMEGVPTTIFDITWE